MKTDRKPHPLVLATLARAEREAGRPVDPLAAFGWLAELDKLARSIDAPPPADHAAELDLPIILDGIAFYRPSWAAYEFFDHAQAVLEGWAADLAVCWACAHARNPDAIRTAMGLPAAELRSRIRAWARGLRCSYEAVSRIVRSLVTRQSEAAQEDNGNPAQFGSIVSALVREYGQTADYWVFCSMDIVNQRLTDMALRAEAERKAIAGDKPAAPDPCGYSAMAQRRYNAAAAKFLVWVKA